MLGQRRDVCGPLPQRWHLDGEDAQAIEQVLPELPGPDFRFQIAVGGGDHTYIHLDGPLVADALELLLLQRPQ